MKAAKGNKVAIEAAKARAAANSAATPPAPFASKTQAEFHALLEQYRDVVYTERAAPGSIPKEPVTDDGLGGGGDDVMDAYLLHAVAHVMRTRQRVTKNNEALLRRAKAAEAELAARRAAERAAATEAAVASALASGGKEGEGEKAAAARKKPKGGSGQGGGRFAARPRVRASDGSDPRTDAKRRGEDRASAPAGSAPPRTAARTR